MAVLFSASQPPRQPNGVVTAPSETPTPLTSLVATQAAKLLSSSSAATGDPFLALAATGDPSLALAAIGSLRDAHRTIDSFLSLLEPQISAGDEPMPDLRDGEEEEGSRIVDEVEERMRNCVLQSKRRKRRPSPSLPAGRAADRVEEISSVNSVDRRRSTLDLVFQFHA